jgi:L-seryl-tRNA(Ser) seleniumtransferase
VVSPESGFSAGTLASALAAGDPPIIVRDHEIERGHLFLDPCNLHPGEAEIVSKKIVETLTTSNAARFQASDRRIGIKRLRNWPD